MGIFPMRPLTPPYMRFRIRRFRALTPSEGVRLVVFGYLLSNVALAYPLIPSYFLQVASLRSNCLIDSYSHQLLIRCTVWSFPVGTCALGTMTSADFSQFVVTTRLSARLRDLSSYGRILSILCPPHLHRPFRIVIGL